MNNNLGMYCESETRGSQEMEGKGGGGKGFTPWILRVSTVEKEEENGGFGLGGKIMNSAQSKKRSGLKKNKWLVLDIGRFPLIVINDDYDYAITPEETDISLSMRDENLDTIPATESDKVIKSIVEDLVPILSESEGIPDTMCDVHLDNNHTPLEAKDHVEIVVNSKDDISSSDDDSLYNENIEYVEASPHDSELVSLEVAEIVIPEKEEIEDDNLCEKLLNVHLLIANIKALKDNPPKSSEFLTKSSSTSPKYFLEETNTFHNSLPEFENFALI
nr:hypothetical protein [Tanacetum cinerariifolium]